MSVLNLKFVESLKSKELWRATVVEIFGMMLLVYIPQATIAVAVIDGKTIAEIKEAATNSSSSGPAIDSPVNTRMVIFSSFVIGFTIATLVLGLSHISNHINPGISLSLFLRGSISLVRVFIFFVAQTLGAAIGALLLYATVPLTRYGTYLCTTVNPSVSIGEALGVEICTTAVFIFGTWLSFEKLSEGGKTPVLPVVGCTLSLAMPLTMGGPLTGGSMNPARSTGAALVIQGKCWDHHWIYWVGPLTGAVIASICTIFIYDWKPEIREEQEQDLEKPDIKPVQAIAL